MTVGCMRLCVRVALSPGCQPAESWQILGVGKERGERGGFQSCVLTRCPGTILAPWSLDALVGSEPGSGLMLLPVPGCVSLSR